MSGVADRCPKCNGEMAQGFLFEIDGQLRKVDTWVEGAPQKAWIWSVKIPADKCVPVGTFRCSACGFLESFARPEFAAQ